MLRPLIYKCYYQFCKPPMNTYCFQIRWLSRNRLFSSACKESKDDNCDRMECNDKLMKSNEGRCYFTFHNEIEAAMNEHINFELKACYYYLSMAVYFGHIDIVLPGCESFFMQMHHEEHRHALKFLKYMKIRGGKVHLRAISSPNDQNWKCPLHAFKTGLQMEIDISKKLVALNAIAEKHGDINASDFIITGFMKSQMKSINEFGRLVSILSGVGDRALSRFIFDKELLENYVISDFNVLKHKSYPETPNT